MHRKCKVCGCTERLPCVTLDVPCCWVQEDLCSACATVPQLLQSEDNGLPWLIAVIGEHAGRVLLSQLEPANLFDELESMEIPVVWRGGI